MQAEQLRNKIFQAIEDKESRDIELICAHRNEGEEFYKSVSITYANGQREYKSNVSFDEFKKLDKRVINPELPNVFTFHVRTNNN